jgi:hypothetical protein
VKFTEARRHVKNLGDWEGRELLLAQLPNDVRCKLITEEDKRSRLRVSLRGLPRMALKSVCDFFKGQLGLTVTRVIVSKEGYEAQLTDEADRTLVLSVSGRRFTN